MDHWGDRADSALHQLPAIGDLSRSPRQQPAIARLTLSPILQTFDDQTRWKPWFSGVKSRLRVVMGMQNRRTRP